MGDDDEQKGYTWEAAYAEGLNIGEVLQEDEHGSVEKSVAKLILDAKRKRRLVDRPTKIRLGIMRYVFIVIDTSLAMSKKVMLPSRLSVAVKILNQFLDKFCEQNPISQVGIIICKDKRAEILVSLNGNMRCVKDALSTLTEQNCYGEFSLQNSLQLAMSSLKGYPGHASREIITIMASMSTCDPSNIFGTIELLRRANIRCSVISLNAEVFVCKKLCMSTSGRYDVVLDKSHFELLMNSHTNPPVSKRSMECSVVRMGFPSHQNIVTPAFCQCHVSDPRPGDGRGFLCLQCGARYCSLPVECRVCKMMLISAPQLARASLHLTPLAAFKEVDSSSGQCFGCSRPLDAKSYACKQCETLFCIDCDLLLHESLQICPACPQDLSK
ncbi:hypothetical protein AB6A40_002509 [Gnathostoma spinigerum]|uniref:General transcription factor IIH subunit n=1 Tax=Gnathostoma spinigerum TaxID=75299 RepID=A0ABD6E6S5_9BILA